MRYLRFTNWLTELDQLSGPIAAIWYEEVRRHAGTDAAHVYGGLMATLTAWAELRGVPYQGVPVGTIKQHATGKGNATKEAMIAAARARGFSPSRRQRGGRARHPALGDRHPGRCAVKGEAMLRQAARVVGQRRRAYGDPAASMAAVAARWSITLGQPVTAGAGGALPDRPEARPARPRSGARGLDPRRRRLRRGARGGAVMNAMKWHPRGYGGQRRAPDQVKRDGWREQGVLAVAIDDERLTWPERELVRQLGDKLYGKRPEAAHG